jgi:hypothetical protein
MEEVFPESQLGDEELVIPMYWGGHLGYVPFPAQSSVARFRRRTWSTGRAMKRALAARLARLESRAVLAEHCVTIRFGHLKRLSAKYVGERHIVVGRQLPSQGDQEWVEFEEVRGPDPNSPVTTGCRAGHPMASRLDVIFVNAPEV